MLFDNHQCIICLIILQIIKIRPIQQTLLPFHLSSTYTLSKKYRNNQITLFYFSLFILEARRKIPLLQLNNSYTLQLYIENIYELNESLIILKILLNKYGKYVSSQVSLLNVLCTVINEETSQNCN